MYEEIGQMIEENEEEDAETEPPRLNYHDVEHILTSSGVEDVDPDKVKETLKTVFDNEQHEFKADSLVPKKVKINTEIAKLSIDAQHLKNVKYINYEGRRCLLLEIENEKEEYNTEIRIYKKVKNNTDITKLSIDPQHLKNVKYINYEGRRCLLLEIEDDVEIEGFQLESASNNR